MWGKISENVPEIGIFEKSTFWKKIKRRKFWLSTLKYSQSTNFRSFGAITPRLMGFSPQILFHCNLFNTWNKVKCYFDITNEQFQDFLKIFLFYWQKKHDIAMKSVKTEFIEVHRVSVTVSCFWPVVSFWQAVIFDHWLSKNIISGPWMASETFSVSAATWF